MKLRFWHFALLLGVTLILFADVHQNVWIAALGGAFWGASIREAFEP